VISKAFLELEEELLQGLLGWCRAPRQVPLGL
jgi:hypothetical protein